MGGLPFLMFAVIQAQLVAAAFVVAPSSTNKLRLVDRAIAGVWSPPFTFAAAATAAPPLRLRLSSEDDNESVIDGQDVYVEGALSKGEKEASIERKMVPEEAGEEPIEVVPESAALKWAREQQQQQTAESEPVENDRLPMEEKQLIAASAVAATDPSGASPRPLKFVVVGAGWGGWGAAKALCQASAAATGCRHGGPEQVPPRGYEVTILDALPDPTGRTMPYRSASGKPVEAGTRGFWKDYPNINRLCAELGLPESDVFTDYTNSSFYSPDGLEATAPVFASAKLPTLLPSLLPPFVARFLADRALPELPSPLGQVLATFPLFERIPLVDRASMVGLLAATVDCLGGDETVQMAYDRMTAHELFLRFGLSDRLVRDFITPTLLVGLFKPPEELSALVVMELLYYYALAHTDSFDVRWIKNGTVADSLTAPLATMLETEHNLTILGGCRVKKISTVPVRSSLSSSSDARRVTAVEYTDAHGNAQTINDVDGVVLAVTSKGMQAIVGNSPDLARYPVFAKAASCAAGIDVISVRLWFDRAVPTRTPANVLSRFDELRGAGGTFFMLDQLQSGNVRGLWGGDEPRGSVVACDFYNAGALLSLPDEELIHTLTHDLLPAAVPAFADAVLVDSWIGRYPGAVSWFAPGSFDKRPPLEGAGRDQIANLKCAGDWVRMGEREHGAKGLCQERAYVSGLEAANALLRDSGVAAPPHTVLPVREDEVQFKAAIAANRVVMKFVPRFWVR